MKILKYILIIILFINGDLVFSQIAKISADTTLGCDSLVVTFNDLSTITQPDSTLWEWIFGDGTAPYYEQSSNYSKTLRHAYKTAGSYFASLILENINSRGLVYSDTITIIVSQTPSAFFQCFDTNIDSIKNLVAPAQNGNGPYVNKWIINSIDTMYGTELKWKFKNNSVDTVLLRVNEVNPPGCSNELSKKISIENLVVPNVFTPDGDGINDLFLVQTNGTTVYALNIYSRNGVLVYKSVSPTVVWDGMLQSGIKASSGTYFYTIESVDGVIHQDVHGFVVLIGVDK